MDKDGSGSPRKDNSRSTSCNDLEPASSTESSVEMDTDTNDEHVSSSLPLPSADHDSPFTYLTPLPFELNSQDFSLNTINMADDYGYDLWPKSGHRSGPDDGIDMNLKRLHSPAKDPFGELDLSMPGSTAPMTPAEGSGTSQLQQTTPSSSRAAEHISFDTKNWLGDTQPCSCSQSAVRMLEGLELKDYDDIELSSDVVLNNIKGFSKQFHTWLTCEQCPTPKATSMLLALIIERLSLYLEKGVAHYIRDLQRNACFKDDNDTRLGPSVVGCYQIESRHELTHIMRVLLVIKGRELVAAVAKLKKRGILDALLAGTEGRIRRIISELTSWDG